MTNLSNGMRKFLYTAAFVPAILWSAGISYTVNFEGLDDPVALKGVKNGSQLIFLRKKPPPSLNSLRYRAESDAALITQILHSYGYFEARVTIELDQGRQGSIVRVIMHPGPQYNTGKVTLNTDLLNQEEIGLPPNCPAYTQEILDAELCALHILSRKGYPLAKVDKREIVADGETKKVDITFDFDLGPFSRFGPTTIQGNCKVKSEYIDQFISWSQGQGYDSQKVDCTQKELMDTCLFSSVFITHGDVLDAQGELPMILEVEETRHKSISLGASYQTTYGLGATIGWENRNVGGMGNRLSLQADITQRGQWGYLSYLVPHFYLWDQDFLSQAQASTESITAYKSESYYLLNRISRKVTPRFYFSAGLKAEYLRVSSSVDNGKFGLIEAPFHLRWTTVSDLLCPIKGVTFEYYATPTLNVRDTSDFYYYQEGVFSSYVPLVGQDSLIWAQKLTLGATLSNGLGAVPVPRRFLGGSEYNLRGYKYLTVSPLNEDDKPIGGRSALYYSLEMRGRLTEHFGLVPFFDIGNVYLESFPKFTGKWRKSLGLGFRYYSFVGPLRLDLAFPLDRRKGIDPAWWVFVSVGEAF